jgi:predicted signal transduction protein with EAL and GGDEF domain
MNRLVAVINAGMDIFLTICAILLGLALVIYLFYKINKEKFRYVESGDTRYNYDEDKFKKFIDNKISNASKKTEFVLAKLEINDLSSIKKNLGDIQFSIFKKQFIVRLFGIYGFGTKICFSDNNILLYLRYENQFEDLSNIAKTIVDKMTEPFKFSSSLSLELSINVGVAGFPISGSTTEELLQNISLALLDSKRQGSNQFTIYNDSLKNMATDEYKYYLEIQQAIENKNFTVYYQPIVNIKTGEVFCGEGLLRWENPEKGVLSPSKFIGIMEQTGDIVWVGYWSFDSMTKTFATWQKNYPDYTL